MANFYVKEGLGIMCQTILFDDMEIFQTEDFFEIFHSFRFE
ncbi:hypothetical protein [Spirochaeta isovalerica]|uniref:Uncharacterized protein n=1 Tax=Spirochaeta isovalerica TaxID=150 RepID=A0A841RCW7_9SPIO|nr:hypothetical protein [Spirochaeta isovalerica]MBB6481506.1 hypothetical protein [Spirochaeta isovalerica]